MRRADKKKLTKPGGYTIICTHHGDMSQSIRVMR